MRSVEQLRRPAQQPQLLITLDGVLVAPKHVAKGERDAQAVDAQAERGIGHDAGMHAHPAREGRVRVERPLPIILRTRKNFERAPHDHEVGII